MAIKLSHPDLVVESLSLASVEPPDISYHLNFSEEYFGSGKLSALQLETITYVGQKHDRFLPDGRLGLLRQGWAGYVPGYIHTCLLGLGINP